MRRLPHLVASGVYMKKKNDGSGVCFCLNEFGEIGTRTCGYCADGPEIKVFTWLLVFSLDFEKGNAREVRRMLEDSFFLGLQRPEIILWCEACLLVYFRSSLIAGFYLPLLRFYFQRQGSIHSVSLKRQI